MFGRCLFIEITIFLRRGIPIPLKNEKNSYFSGNILDLKKKKPLLCFILFHFFKKKKKEPPTLPPLIVVGQPPQWVVSQPLMALGVVQPPLNSLDGGLATLKYHSESGCDHPRLFRGWSTTPKCEVFYSNCNWIIIKVYELLPS